MNITHLALEFRDKADKIYLNLLPEELNLFRVGTETLNDLFAMGEAIFSRSTKDVFPFYIRGIDVYRHSESFLNSISSNKIRITWKNLYSNSKFHLLQEYMKKYQEIFEEVVQNESVIRLVLQLETIYSVFQEGRRILGETDKTEKQIRDEVKEFLRSIELISSWDERYLTIAKRFQMYDRELYVAYTSKWVPCTNNDLEYFNRTVKRPICKNRGQHTSWFYMEHLSESIALQQNFRAVSYSVAGTIISDEEQRSPLQRLGIINNLNVSTILNSTTIELINEKFKGIDDRYNVHRWVCRLRKKGILKCIDGIFKPWNDMIKKAQSNNKKQAIK